MHLALQNHPPFVLPAHELATDRTASDVALNPQYLRRMLYESSDELGVLNHAHLCVPSTRKSR